MIPVTVYSTMLCPYSVAAKNLLKTKGVPYEEIDVTLNPKKRADMSQRSGGLTSVPQIFIGDTHVGGFDDLMALERQGELNNLLGI